MRWFNRLLSLRAEGSVYEARGILSLDSPGQDGWTPVPSTTAAPELAGPLPRISGYARPGALAALLAQHQNVAPEPDEQDDWLSRLKPSWERWE